VGLLPGAARPQPSESDKAFEVVRQSFLARLPGELERVVTLVAEHRAAENDCTPVLRNIATYAHRLRGAAAVFGALELGTAARAAELAAEAVLDKSGTDADGRVSTTLRILAAALAHIIGSDSSVRVPLSGVAQPRSAI
jgi:HPt (histidine-containing phosphotransfer) domain-containing protein